REPGEPRPVRRAAAHQLQRRTLERHLDVQERVLRAEERPELVEHGPRIGEVLEHVAAQDEIERLPAELRRAADARHAGDRLDPRYLVYEAIVADRLR